MCSPGSTESDPTLTKYDGPRELNGEHESVSAAALPGRKEVGSRIYLYRGYRPPLDDRPGSAYFSQLDGHGRPIFQVVRTTGKATEGSLMAGSPRSGDFLRDYLAWEQKVRVKEKAGSGRDLHPNYFSRI